MKRILALSLSAALLLALLGGCTAGGPENTETPDPTAGTSASVSPDTSQEPSLALPSEGPSEGPSPEASTEPSQEPSEAPATQAPATHHPEESHHPATQAPATQAPATHHPEESHHPATQAPATQAPATQAPATQAPESSPGIPGFGGVVIPGFGGGGGGTSSPSPSPSQSAGGNVLEPTGRTENDVDLEAFLFGLFDSEDYAFPGMDGLSTEFIGNLFPGLTAVPCVQRVVYTTAIGFNTAEIALVQVTNSSDVNTVKSILQTRIDSQIAGGAYYPAAVDQWKNNHRIVEHGNYIMMVVHSSCDDIVADFNALF